MSRRNTGVTPQAVNAHACPVRGLHSIRTAARTPARRNGSDPAAGRPGPLRAAAANPAHPPGTRRRARYPPAEAPRGVARRSHHGRDRATARAAWHPAAARKRAPSGAAVAADRSRGRRRPKARAAAATVSGGGWNPASTRYVSPSSSNDAQPPLMPASSKAGRIAPTIRPWVAGAWCPGACP